MREITCPNCSSGLPITYEETKTLACDFCGSVIDLTDEKYSVLAQQNPNDFPPRSFIKLGMIGTFRGKSHQVIGRISYSSKCTEWDDEDHKYYTSNWSYDEWTLVSEDKEFAYLYEDDEGYAISRAFTPTAPSIPSNHAEFMTLESEGVKHRITERNLSKINYIEGEFTYSPNPRESVESIEYDAGGIQYSVSQRFGEIIVDGPLEVEFYQSNPLTKIEVAFAFEQQDIIDEEERKLAWQEECKMWSWGFVATGLLCLFLLFTTFGKGGKEIASYTYSYSQTSAQGLVRGPIVLKKEGTVHKIVLTTSIPDQSYSWGGLELLDANQEPINAMEGEFWRESGYDDGGRWSEAVTSATYMFNLEKAGAYFIRLLSEVGTARSGTINVKIYEGVVLSRYYLIAAILSLCFAFAIRKYKSLNPWYIVVGVLVVGLLILELFGNDD